MKFRTLLLTSTTIAGLALGIAACSMDSHVWSTRHSAMYTQEATKDPVLAGDRFLKQISYARLALATNNVTLAKDHIATAHDLAMIIQQEEPQQRTIVDVKAGIVTYDYHTKYEYFYFPIETSANKTKKTTNPKWINKGLKITDAEIVYLSMDLNNKDIQRRLGQADEALSEGKNQDAEYYLGKLSKEIVTGYVEVPDSLEKASDNIALGRRFIAEGNYAGARYALGHADDALNQMQGDDNYSAHRAAIIAMRKHVKYMQDIIAKNDPTMMQKADAKMSGWWHELKDWAHE